MFYLECIRAFGIHYGLTFTCNKYEIDGDQELSNSFRVDIDTQKIYFKSFESLDNQTFRDFCQYDFDI